MKRGSLFENERKKPLQISSPLTDSNNTVLEDEISCEAIIKLYKDDYGINVSDYFDGLDSIQIYKCIETGYRFYYPFHLTANENFYGELQKIPWYYSVWKWEHQVANSFINLGDLVLEIGCGQGEFIEKIQQKGTKCTGLEFNKDAVKIGQKKGLDILNQSIQEHAQTNPETYDKVCLFQVLEHVSSVKDFIYASLDTLKPNGKLIVGVPNNNPFLFKHDKYHTLNMPPHHMGLWNKKSLINIQKVFDICVDKVEVEPLQPYEYALYHQLQIQHLKSRSELAGKAVDRLLYPVSTKLMHLFGKYIQGRNILAVYTKNG